MPLPMSKVNQHNDLALGTPYFSLGVEFTGGMWIALKHSSRRHHWGAVPPGYSAPSVRTGTERSGGANL